MFLKLGLNKENSIHTLPLQPLPPLTLHLHLLLQQLDPLLLILPSRLQCHLSILVSFKSVRLDRRHTVQIASIGKEALARCRLFNINFHTNLRPFQIYMGNMLKYDRVCDRIWSYVFEYGPI